jgi:predicted glycoside hydrolase/deacetylase ChbG (UPF0249 family)
VKSRAPRLIINADDFGLTEGVNRGILEAFREGVVTSTTLLANMDAFDDAATLAREHPDLPVGVHLNLVWGRPVSDPGDVPSLLDEGGRFPGSFAALAGRYLAGRLVPGEAAMELRRQIEKVVAAGIQPTHVDTHKHIHGLKWAHEAVLSAAGPTGIRSLRLPLPSPEDTARLSVATRCRRAALSWLSRRRRPALRERGMRTPERLIGLVDLLDEEALVASLRRVPGGVTELMCHPGYVDPALLRCSRVPPHRGVELRALKSRRVRETIRDCGIELIGFRDL